MRMRRSGQKWMLLEQIQVLTSIRMHWERHGVIVVGARNTHSPSVHWGNTLIQVNGSRRPNSVCSKKWCALVVDRMMPPQWAPSQEQLFLQLKRCLLHRLQSQDMQCPVPLQGIQHWNKPISASWRVHHCQGQEEHVSSMELLHWMLCCWTMRAPAMSLAMRPFWATFKLKAPWISMQMEEF